MTKTLRGAEPPAAADLPPALPGTRGDTIMPREVDWLWFPYMPRGMLTTLSGDPAAGKSWIAASISACLTSGAPFPLQSTRRKPENVIMLNSEDALAETQVPRLIGLGADMSRIFLTERGFSINKASIAALREFVLTTNASLLTIDPIQSWMGTGYDMNKATDVRSWTDLLTDLAAETGIAVLMIGHKRKSKRSDGDDNPLYQGLGSVDFVGASRSVLHAKADDGEQRFMEHVKASVGPPGDPLAYSIEPRGGGESPFRWLGPYEGSSYGRAAALSPAYDAAKAWLAEQLAECALPVDEICDRAAKENPPISLGTLKRARAEIANTIRRGNEWWWALRHQPTGGKKGKKPLDDASDDAV